MGLRPPPPVSPSPPLLWSEDLPAKVEGMIAGSRMTHSGSFGSLPYLRQPQLTGATISYRPLANVGEHVVAPFSVCAHPLRLFNSRLLLISAGRPPLSFRQTILLTLFHLSYFCPLSSSTHASPVTSRVVRDTTFCETTPHFCVRLFAEGAQDSIQGASHHFLTSVLHSTLNCAGSRL